MGIARIATLTAMALTIGGCGGGDGGAQAGAPAEASAPGAPSTATGSGAAAAGSGGGAAPPAAGDARAAPATATPNRQPTLSGTPATSAAALEDYVFTPEASDPDGDTLRFSVRQLPAWAGLDSATGRITGRPRSQDQGVHGPISLSVSDGTHEVSLPDFSVTVVASTAAPRSAPPGQSRRAVTLRWQAPDRKEDGSPIGRPPTYRIHYGQESRAYPFEVALTSPGTYRYTFTDLVPGRWYVALTTVDEDGLESDLSDETEIVVN
jgi:hypothetical protein